MTIDNVDSAHGVEDLETIESPAPVTRTPAELAGIATAFASSSGWIEKVRLRADRRWYERLHDGPDYDVWLISWLPDQSTGFHDHGASSGAFVVVTGVLEEHSVDGSTHNVHAGNSREFGPDYAHDVRNASLAPAISIHAYSPPLTEMNEYELKDGLLVARDGAIRQPEVAGDGWRSVPGKLASRTNVSRVDGMLAAARERLRRLSPHEVREAVARDRAVLVDIRPAEQREVEGHIADALIVDRNVLEWRLDPTSNSRLPVAAGQDLRLIVFCSEGYASSLAAAALQDLGLWRATDMAGGFQAWREAGLPIVQPG